MKTLRCPSTGVSLSLMFVCEHALTLVLAPVLQFVVLAFVLMQ